LQPFVTKLASAIYVLFVNGTMLISGLYQINKNVSEMEKDKALGLIEGSIIKDYINTNVDKFMQDSLIVTMLIIPLFFIVGSYFFYRKKYRIDEKFYSEIITQLQERAESNQ
jgi:melibiose permease/lactose/raffinose/galactose permease